MSIYRSVNKRKDYRINEVSGPVALEVAGQHNAKTLAGITASRLETLLIWGIGLCVGVGIVIINTKLHYRDLAATFLYVSLLLMAANFFTLRAVVGVALISMSVILIMFFIDEGYKDWEVLTGFVRCLTALSAIAFLALRGKQAADSLRRNEVYLTGAQRLSQTGSVGFRGDIDHVTWSAECARIFEFPPELSVNKAMILQRAHPDDHPLVHEVFEKAARHVPQIEVRHRLIMPDGRIKHIHMIATPLFTKEGRFEYLGALKDVTERKQAEEMLLRTQAELAHIGRLTTLGELVATIAHEVNQPLASINSSAEACRRWLDRPDPDMAEAISALTRINQSAFHAGEVINRVRTLSRKCDPVRKPERFNDIVSETLCLVQHEMVHHGIRSRVELVSLDPWVMADRVQVQQVIINLVINACQALGQVPRNERVIFVRTCLIENDVRVEVTDSGPGIDESALSSLFNPFFTTKVGGLGMGLSICRSIIDFHGGRIWAASDNGGASFFFALPLIENQLPQEASIAGDH